LGALFALDRESVLSEIVKGDQKFCGGQSHGYSQLGARKVE
jgi:hypothetical protein